MTRLLVSSSAALGRLPDVLLGSVITYGAFLVALAATPVPLQRMYFYVEASNALLLGCSVAVLLRSRNRRALIVPCLLLSGAYFELKLAHAPFSYSGGLVDHLLRS